MLSPRYQNLLDYIGYFEQENFDFCTWQSASQTDDCVIEMGYPIYDEGVKRFVKEVYDSDLLMSNYLDYFEKHQIDPGKMSVNIAAADFSFCGLF